jgi:hypothetical protein
METNPVAITYGRTHNNEIRTFFVSSMDKAKEVAKEFIHVFPAELESYVTFIDKWDGKDSLVITHQDDDTFYFNATVVSVFLDFEDETSDDTFTQFVKDFNSDE